MSPREMTSEEAVEAIMESFKVDSDEGVLRVFGERFYLAVPRDMVTFQKALEGMMGNAARAPCYAAGEDTAKDVARRAREWLKVDETSDPTTVVLSLTKLWSACGFGHIEIDFGALDEGMVNFAVRNSLIAAAYGPSDRPVCHFYAGFGAGTMKEIFGVDAHCEEVACASTGAELCQFQIAPLEYHTRRLLEAARNHR